jgi:uncharacterized small protein (DUF1192 family)
LLLLLQGVSELIKRIAFLKGLIEDPTKKKGSRRPKKNWPSSAAERSRGQAAQAGALK